MVGIREEVREGGVAYTFFCDLEISALDSPGCQDFGRVKEGLVEESPSDQASDDLFEEVGGDAWEVAQESVLHHFTPLYEISVAVDRTEQADYNNLAFDSIFPGDTDYLLVGEEVGIEREVVEAFFLWACHSDSGIC